MALTQEITTISERVSTWGIDRYRGKTRRNALLIFSTLIIRISNECICIHLDCNRLLLVMMLMRLQEYAWDAGLLKYFKFKGTHNNSNWANTEMCTNHLTQAAQSRGPKKKVIHVFDWGICVVVVVVLSYRLKILPRPEDKVVCFQPKYEKKKSWKELKECEPNIKRRTRAMQLVWLLQLKDDLKTVVFVALLLIQ